MYGLTSWHVRQAIFGHQLLIKCNRFREVKTSNISSNISSNPERSLDINYLIYLNFLVTTHSTGALHPRRAGVCNCMCSDFHRVVFQTERATLEWTRRARERGSLRRRARAGVLGCSALRPLD